MEDMDMEDQDQNNRIAPARFQLIFSIGKEGKQEEGEWKRGNK